MHPNAHTKFAAYQGSRDAYAMYGLRPTGIDKVAFGGAIASLASKILPWVARTAKGSAKAVAAGSKANWQKGVWPGLKGDVGGFLGSAFTPWRKATTVGGAVGRPAGALYIASNAFPNRTLPPSQSGLGYHGIQDFLA